MAEPIDKKLIEREPVGGFDAPIPGESLTSSPDNAKSWERPSQYVNEDRAMEALYLLLTDQDKLPELIKLIDSGTALDEIAQVILYQGYTAGQYNPDLMLSMIEPTLYLLISIADYAGIKDYVLYEGEEDDPDTIIMDDDITPINADEDEEDTNEKPRIEKPSKDVISSSLLARIETELPEKLSKEKE